jgi:hypothetical protein
MPMSVPVCGTPRVDVSVLFRPVKRSDSKA